MVELNTDLLDDYTIKIINSTNPRFWNQLAICISKIDGFQERIQDELNDRTYRHTDSFQQYINVDDDWNFFI